MPLAAPEISPPSRAPFPFVSYGYRQPTAVTHTPHQKFCLQTVQKFKKQSVSIPGSESYEQYLPSTMFVVQTLPSPEKDVWYLAYGSNISTKKFIHDRGIKPISSAIVTVPGWTLSMSSAGVPYSEPAFATILPIHSPGSEKAIQVIGTAYQLSPGMYKKVLASEGGGIAYAEVEVRAEVLKHDEDGLRGPPGNLPVRSLVTVLRREARPSVRYMVLGPYPALGFGTSTLTSTRTFSVRGLPRLICPRRIRGFSPPSQFFAHLRMSCARLGLLCS